MWRDKEGRIKTTSEVMEEIKRKYHLVCPFCRRALESKNRMTLDMIRMPWEIHKRRIWGCEKVEENMTKGCDDFEPAYFLGYQRITRIQERK